jgi:hypothetical protein
MPALSLLSAVYYLLLVFAVYCLLSTVRVCGLLFAVCCLLSLVWCLLPALCSVVPKLSYFYGSVCI